MDYVFDKNMSNGMRHRGDYQLNTEEIKMVEDAIQELRADRDVFVINDSSHIRTCYNPELDKVFVAGDVLPDMQYGSTHPRDLMSIKAVLAHEYYGHRPNREEYLYDITHNTVTTPRWQDECRASINAAKNAPALDRMDKSYLVLDAVYRAKEFGMVIETDDFMKEVLYGYTSEERNFINDRPIVFVRDESETGILDGQRKQDDMPQMQINHKRIHRR